MSTRTYYECTSHTPPIRSDEIGQHYYDVPNSQELLKHRELFVALRAINLTARDSDLGDIFDNARIRFLEDHPDCTIRIVNEYGEDVTDYRPPEGN